MRGSSIGGRQGGYLRKPFTPEQVKEKEVTPLLGRQLMKAPCQSGLDPHSVPSSMDPELEGAVLEEAALEVFQTMANAHLLPNPDPDGEPSGGHTAMVGMAGALCGMTTVRCSQASSAKLASLMLGESVQLDQSTARDALGEICNMIAGNFKGKLSQLADQCMLSVPTVITGEDYAMSALDPSDGITISSHVSMASRYGSQ